MAQSPYHRQFPKAKSNRRALLISGNAQFLLPLDSEGYWHIGSNELVSQESRASDEIMQYIIYSEVPDWLCNEYCAAFKKAFDMLHNLSHPSVRASVRLLSEKYIYPCKFRSMSSEVSAVPTLQRASSQLQRLGFLQIQEMQYC